MAYIKDKGKTQAGIKKTEYQDNEASPSSNGDVARNGDDVEVYSGGAVKNLSKMVNEDHLQQSKQALTDESTISWDATSGGYGEVTLTDDRTLGNMSGVEAGATYKLRIIQDPTGGRKLDYESNYKFPGGVKPELSSSADAVDELEFRANATDELVLTNAIFDIG